jgi:hypothetical protein
MHTDAAMNLFRLIRYRCEYLEFYRKHGYRETGTGFYGQIEMVKYRKDPLS